MLMSDLRECIMSSMNRRHLRTVQILPASPRIECIMQMRSMYSGYRIQTEHIAC